jgi:hypothetical protein
MLLFRKNWLNLFGNEGALPDALVRTFKDTGHLTILIDQDEFMKIMKEFLEG